MEKEPKPQKPLVERKLKALEEYLGIVFEDDEDFAEYHDKTYAVRKRTDERLEALEKKTGVKRESKHFWN